MTLQQLIETCNILDQEFKDILANLEDKQASLVKAILQNVDSIHPSDLKTLCKIMHNTANLYTYTQIEPHESDEIKEVTIFYDPDTPDIKLKIKYPKHLENDQYFKDSLYNIIVYFAAYEALGGKADKHEVASIMDDLKVYDFFQRLGIDIRRYLIREFHIYFDELNQTRNTWPLIGGWITKIKIWRKINYYRKLKTFLKRKNERKTTFGQMLDDTLETLKRNAKKIMEFVVVIAGITIASIAAIRNMIEEEMS